MKIYLVRHGETYSNLAKIYCGSGDSKLTEKGIGQAEVVKEKLSHIKFQKAFCSEKKRTRTTADIILGHSYESILIEDYRLNETDFGIFENKTYDDIVKIYPEETQKWNLDWKGYVIPDGESVLQTFERLKLFIKDLEALKNYEDILIVTHGGLIRLFYCYILDGNMELFWKFSTKNTGISVLKYEYDNWYIDSIGDTNY